MKVGSSQRVHFTYGAVVNTPQMAALRGVPKVKDLQQHLDTLEKQFNITSGDPDKGITVTLNTDAQQKISAQLTMPVDGVVMHFPFHPGALETLREEKIGLPAFKLPIQQALTGELFFGPLKRFIQKHYFPSSPKLMDKVSSHYTNGLVIHALAEKIRAKDSEKLTLGLDDYGVVVHALKEDTERHRAQFNSEPNIKDLIDMLKIRYQIDDLPIDNLFTEMQQHEALKISEAKSAGERLENILALLQSDSATEEFAALQQKLTQPKPVSTIVPFGANK